MIDPRYNPYPWSGVIAHVRGGPLAPQINGIVWFTDIYGRGTRVCAEIMGLPPYQPAEDGKSPIGPFGFHIHENGSCAIGNPEDPFQQAGGHWNPTHQPHGSLYSLEHTKNANTIITNHIINKKGQA